ncbi:MAG: nitroreductase family protein [Verrucomicrobiae bacterium]|nr:nitroreductase family protein [Verrucomicrobiae bacterium]
MKSQQTFQSLIESRVTTGHFDATRAVSHEAVRQLVRLATKAPSAFNLQNWRFVAVRSSEAKELLCELAYGQAQVKEAAVTFIVCGQLDGYRDLPETLQPSVEVGAIPASLGAKWSSMVAELHQDNPQLRRDEAFRSASLAAMILMLAAQDQGLASGAMSGFDPEAVVSRFELGEQFVPVMLVTVGHPAGSRRPQKVRKPVGEILEFR